MKTIPDIPSELEKSEARKNFMRYVRDEFENADGIIEKFDALTKLYFEVNSVINISALRTVDDVYTKHYLDSIYPHKFFFGAIADVGCGGGFPTIPLAIVKHDLQITGVDSVGKKLLLMKRCTGELALKNLKSEYARSEDLVKMHKSYDTVCARALADSDKAVSLCAPLLNPDGTLLLYKTQSDDPAKTQTEKKYGVELSDTYDYVLPYTDIKRRLFIYKKTNTRHL